MDAVIFDFDGLILDTETPEVESWRETFSSFSLTFPDAFWQHLLGRGAEQVIQTPIELLQALVDHPIDAEGIKRQTRDRILAKINDNAVQPGVIALLQELQEQEIPASIASSSKHDWVDNHVERLGLKNYFRQITCADDAPRAKPFPDLYLLAAERAGFSPQNCLALEDSPNGVTAARAAGIPVVAIPNTVTSGLDFSHATVRWETLLGKKVSDLKDAHKHG